MEKRVTPNHVDVVYTIIEGEQQFVREVITSGLRTTRPSVIRRAITMKAGDPLGGLKETSEESLRSGHLRPRRYRHPESRWRDEDHKYVLYNFQEANRYTLERWHRRAGRAGVRYPSSRRPLRRGGQHRFSPIISADVTRLNFLASAIRVSLRGNVLRRSRNAPPSTYLQPRFQERVKAATSAYTLLYDDTAQRPHLCLANGGSIGPVDAEVLQDADRDPASPRTARERRQRRDPRTAGPAVRPTRPNRHRLGELRAGSSR